MTGWVAFIVLLGGIAIGATSIGGVVVVPALTALGGIAPERAVAAASFGFAFAGIAAFMARPRHGGASTAATAASAATSAEGEGASHAAGASQTPQATSATQATPATQAHTRPAAAAFGWSAVLGTAAGAATGAATLAWLPARAVALVVALLAIGSGLHVLFGAAHGHRPRALSSAGLPLLGLVVGALSAWSGTGGPVVLLPLLALLGWPPLQAVEAAQRVQLPVAAAATAVNLAAGRLDLLLGAAVGVVVVAGWAAGRFIAARLPVRRLRQAVAVALVATGMAYL